MWGEKTGTATNVDRTVHLSEEAVDPPGQARPDLDILIDLAHRLRLEDKDGDPLVKSSDGGRVPGRDGVQPWPPVRLQPGSPTTSSASAVTTRTSSPGAVSGGLEVFLLTAGMAMPIPSTAALGSTWAPVAMMGLAGVRFVIIEIHETTGSGAGRSLHGWVGILLAVVAFCAGLVTELEGAKQRTALPVGRRGPGRAAVASVGPLAPAALAEEAGVRPQL